MHRDTDPRLRITVLGGIAWQLDGRPLELPDGARGRALLGWIALHPGPHPRARLAERLRPDALDTSARATLRQAVLSVRRALGEEEPADALLVVDRERFGLREGAAWVDFGEQRRLLADGRLAEALALGTADPLPELDDEWAIALRAAHREELRLALARLADEADAAGDAERALRLSRDAAQLDPLSEDALRDLLRRLAVGGDRPAALTTYRAAADRLRRELGIAPSAHTRELVAAIERGEVEGAAPPGAAPSRDGRRSEPAVPSPPIPLPPRLARRARTPFAGRDAELERLAAVWDGGRVSAPLVLVTGEPGAGKTRLAAEFARAMHCDGACVLLGGCEPDMPTPYRPLRELLDGLIRGLAPEQARDLLTARGELVALVPGAAARLGDDLPAPLDGDPDGRRWRLAEELTGLLALLAERRPVLIVLDDLQWADQPSLRLLAYLADAFHDAPVMTLATVRDTDVGAGHLLTATLDALRRHTRVPRIALGGLDDAAVASLLAAWRLPSGRVAELTRRSGGNPFFLELLATTGDGDQPAAIRDAVHARVDALGPDAVEVLTLAALAGDPFEAGLLRSVAAPSRPDGIEPPGVDVALEAAVAAGLVVEEPGPGVLHRFRHALIRETLAAGGGAARRAARHWALADALAERRAEPARVAHHRLAGTAAGDPVTAIATARDAAAGAMRTADYEEAALLLERALKTVPAGDAELRAEVLVELARAARRAHAPERALEAAEEALETAAAPALRAEAALALVGIRAGRARRRPERVALLRTALDALPDPAAGDAPPAGAAQPAAGGSASPAAADSIPLRARLLTALSADVRAGDPGEGPDATSAAAVAAARASGEPATIARALAARRVARWAPEHAHERLDLVDEMLAIATAAGDVEAEALARGWRVVDLLELGRRDGAAAEVALHGELAERLRLPALRCFTALWRATLALLAADAPAAARHHADAAALGVHVLDRDVRPFLAVQQRFALTLTGRASEIDLDAAQAPPAWPTLQAWIHAARGEREHADAALAASGADAGFAPLPGGARWHGAVEAAEAVLALAADPPAPPATGVDGVRAAALALPLIARLEPFAELHAVVSWGLASLGPVHDVLGGLHALAGDRAAAARHWTAALDALHGPYAALHRVRALERWATALADWDERAAARDRLDAALDVLAGRDAPALTQRLRAHRTALG